MAASGCLTLVAMLELVRGVSLMTFFGTHRILEREVDLLLVQNILRQAFVSYQLIVAALGCLAFVPMLELVRGASEMRFFGMYIILKREVDPFIGQNILQH